MTRLPKTLEEATLQVMTSHRIAIFDSRPEIDLEQPTTIASRTPFVVVDRGEGPFTGRRRKLRLQRGGQHVVVRSRTRPLPSDAVGGPLLVQCGLDYRMRRVPICYMDRRELTIHVLLDLDRLEIVQASTGTDPVELLATVLFGDPALVTVQGAGPPGVGPAVERTVAKLFTLRHKSRATLLERELCHIELLCARGGPSFFTERLGHLRRSLEKRRRRMPLDVCADACQRELARLTRLVSSRACAVLQFAEREISGLLNPRRLTASRGVGPLMFVLRLRGPHGRPGLFVWSPLARDRGQRMQRCMGDGELILGDLVDSWDVYGLVDLVLNFVETNGVGAIATDDEAPQRTSGNAWLAELSEET